MALSQPREQGIAALGGPGMGDGAFLLPGFPFQRGLPGSGVIAFRRSGRG